MAAARRPAAVRSGGDFVYALPVLQERFAKLARRDGLTLRQVARSLGEQPEGGHFSAAKVAEWLGLKPVSRGNGRYAKRSCLSRQNAERLCRVLDLDPAELEDHENARIGIVPASARPARHPADRRLPYYPPGRSCSKCEKRLSGYNPGPRCFACAGADSDEGAELMTLLLQEELF